MIRWRAGVGERMVPPSAANALLAQAIAAQPANPALRLKLANLNLDRFDFVAAAAALEVALGLHPALPSARARLGRCYNALGRHDQALEVLGPVDEPEHERAVALSGLGRADEAENEWRAVLTADPHHRLACRSWSKMLRRSGRVAEVVALCEALSATGVGHAQLLYTWGTALALAGDDEQSKAVMFDHERIAELRLPVPEGFDDLAEFNSALAEEILTNPHQLTEFPAEDEANRGSRRVHALFAGRRPELIHRLLEILQSLAAGWTPPRYGVFDPWLDARPSAARLRAWGLIQRGSDYEEWHLHRGGWLSGVYYVRVPTSVSTGGAGSGCIEFGPPSAVQRALPGYVPVWRHRPREGCLLLAPSHYAHRTIPSGADEYRISFAFDVVPEGV